MCACLCTRHVKFELTTLSKLPATGHCTQMERREKDSDMRGWKAGTKGSHKRRLLSFGRPPLAFKLTVLSATCSPAAGYFCPC